MAVDETGLGRVEDKLKKNALVVDKTPAQYFLQKLGIESEFRMSAPVSIGQFHRAVGKGQAGLLQLVENGFDGVGARELALIEKKWFGQTLDGHPYLRGLGYAALAAVSLVTLLVSWNWILAGQVDTHPRTAGTRGAVAPLRQTQSGGHCHVGL